jgi:indole-3-glycerol phosphate synthase
MLQLLAGMSPRLGVSQVPWALPVGLHKSQQYHKGFVVFLEEIVETKRKEIQGRKTRSRQREMEEMISSLPPPRDFLGAISQHALMALIAEIKRASPSLGAIKEDVDIIQVSKEYEKGGASAISVLTEPYFFKGDLAHLNLIKETTSLPILQKDFILDSFQIYEGRFSGADAILLIPALLDREQLKDFVGLAKSLHLVPLVEVHNEDDLKKISILGLPLMGINNRDLRTFEVDLETTLRLKREIPSSVKVISESGIRSFQDVKLLREAGVNGILVGETLMRSADPALKIRELLGI